LALPDEVQTSNAWLRTYQHPQKHFIIPRTGLGSSFQRKTPMPYRFIILITTFDENSLQFSPSFITHLLFSQFRPQKYTNLSNGYLV